MDDFWFFGCIESSGHYLWTHPTRQSSTQDDPRMGFPMWLLDGTFAPVDKVAGHFRLLTIHVRNGNLLTILAGWDNTVDKRPGSNAAFVSHRRYNLEEMQARARKFFPSQAARLFDWEGQPFKIVDEGWR